MSDYNDLLNSLKAAAGSAANMARDFAESAGEKARDLAGNAGEKARLLARLAKLYREANSKRSERDEAYTEIGRLYFESADKKNPGERYVRLFDRVMLANAAIERAEAEMRECADALSDHGVEVDFEHVVDDAEAAARADAEPEGDKIFEFAVYRDKKEAEAEPEVEVEITEEKPEDDKPAE